MTAFKRHPALKRTLLVGSVVLLIGAVGARMYLGTWLLHYVNTVLQHHIAGYRGSVEGIDINLYRGAYRIHNLVLNKENGHIPTPFVSIEAADLSLQWSALFHGRIVSRIILERPTVNFAVKESERQTGTDVDWTKPIRDLMPIDINLVTIRDGQVTYQDFSSSPKVDIYIRKLNGEVRNLRNVENPSDPLPSHLKINGSSIGNGSLRLEGRLNILKNVPDMDLRLQLENAALPAINNYSKAYGSFDFKNGVLDFYSRTGVQDSRVSGYVKLLAHNVAINKTKSSNPLQIAWSTLVEIVITIFTNQSKDQFAVEAPLGGNLNDINSNAWAALGSIFRNAFVSALQKGLNEKGDSSVAPAEEEGN